MALRREETQGDIGLPSAQLGWQLALTTHWQ